MEGWEVPTDGAHSRSNGQEGEQDGGEKMEGEGVEDRRGWTGIRSCGVLGEEFNLI